MLLETTSDGRAMCLSWILVVLVQAKIHQEGRGLNMWGWRAEMGYGNGTLVTRESELEG